MAENTRLITYEKYNRRMGSSFEAQWYVETEAEKPLYEQKFMDDATWAEQSPSGVWPKVLECKVESLVPHQRVAPYLITVKASFDFGGYGGGTDSGGRIIDKTTRKLTKTPFTFNYAWVGISVADREDAGYYQENNIWKQSDARARLNIDGAVSKSGDLIFSNAKAPTTVAPTDKGTAVQATYSPLVARNSLDGISWSSTPGTQLLFRTTFYSSKDMNAITRIAGKTNGTFPSNLAPPSTAAKIWKCHSEDISETVDEEGNTILFVEREFLYSFSAFYWNINLYPSWGTEWA